MSTIVIEFCNSQFHYQLKKKLSERMHLTWCIIDHFCWSFDRNTDYPPNQYIFILYLPQINGPGCDQEKPSFPSAS